jgi:hypothetical protein
LLKKITGSTVPHWPEALGRLSNGMRREMIHKLAGAALSASQLFPDNPQLYLALYNSIHRHVFSTRQFPARFCFPRVCLVSPRLSRAVQVTSFTATATPAVAYTLS